MAQQVTMPDGSIHSFPDEATPDLITAALSPVQAQNTQSPIGAGGRFMQGVEDIPNGMAQLALHGAQQLPDYLQPPGVAGADKVLDQQLQSDETKYQAQRQAAGNTGVDWMRLGGGMAGAAPLAAIAPEAEGGLLARAGIGAAEGAGYGTIQPVTGGGDYASQKGSQIGAGALTGGILTPAIGAVGGAIAPKVAPEVKSLMDEGITPTVGQILGGGYKATEDKLGSIPYLGDIIKTGQKRALDQFNTVALGRALAPIGEDAPKEIGRAGIDAVATKLGEAYDKVLPKLTLTLDDGFAAAVQDAGDKLPSAEQGQFHNIMNKQFEKFGDTGQISGEPLKGFQSQITQEASGYGSDSSYDKRKLGDAFGDVRQALGDALSRSNPTEAQNLQNINKGYANYTTLRRAASGVKEDGPFTPAQLAGAIKGEDKSAGKGNFARGNALMQDLSDPAVSVLSSKYPDSGTAGRALASLAGSAIVGGHFNPALMGAAGAASLPYLNPTAQKLAAAMLIKRPVGASLLRQGVDNATPFLIPGAVTAATQ